MADSIKERAERIEQQLINERYAPGTVEHYRRWWRRYSLFCRENEMSPLEVSSADLFLAESLKATELSTSAKNQAIRSVRILFDIDKGVPRKYCKETKDLSHFANMHQHFIHSFEDSELAPSTIANESYLTFRLLSWLEAEGVTTVDDISTDLVCRYIAGSTGKAPQTRSAELYCLREFMRFICDSYRADRSLGRLFPTIPGNKYTTLPSTYTPEEISRMITALPESGKCPKRDRAIVLLAVLHGMRIGDIKALLLSDIDLQGKRIDLAQNKTYARVVVPLHEECLLAIIDYLKTERPKGDSPHIFLESRAPFSPLGLSNACHYIFSKAYQLAGVDTTGKHHGAHSARHSLATALLATKTPYPVITGILGHRSSNTTMRYLQIDIESLRPLALEVPYGSR